MRGIKRIMNNSISQQLCIESDDNNDNDNDDEGGGEGMRRGCEQIESPTRRKITEEE